MFSRIVWVKKNKNTKAPANVVNQYRVIDNKPTQKKHHSRLDSGLLHVRFFLLGFKKPGQRRLGHPHAVMVCLASLL